MIQLQWKHQCTRNRKWRKMCFQNCSKQRKLKIGESERSNHWKIKHLPWVSKEKYIFTPVCTMERLEYHVPLQVCCAIIQESLGSTEKWKTKGNSEPLFSSWILPRRLLLLSEIWRKGLKSTCGFFQWYHKRYFLFLLTSPHLSHSYKKTSIAPEVGSVRTVIFPCNIFATFPVQK